jgi:hypothetical protein
MDRPVSSSSSSGSGSSPSSSGSGSSSSGVSLPEGQLSFLEGKAGPGLTWQQTYQTDRPEEVEEFCRQEGISWTWLPPASSSSSSGPADQQQKQNWTLRTTREGEAAKMHPATGEWVWSNHAHLFHPSDLPKDTEEALRGVYQTDEEWPKNCTFADGSPIPVEALEQVRGVLREQEVVFSWRQGDVLVLDNLLTAHGRKAFRGPRKIVVAMA